MFFPVPTSYAEMIRVYEEDSRRLALQIRLASDLSPRPLLLLRSMLRGSMRLVPHPVTIADYDGLTDGDAFRRREIPIHLTYLG